VNALANEQVGNYLNDHFVSSYQKVGSFRLVNGKKQGGNVASYFCLADGSVLHVVAGPADAATLLREARWVVENRKLAVATSKGDIDEYKAFFRNAHAERLRREHGLQIESQLPSEDIPPASFAARMCEERGKRRASLSQGVHQMLAAYPLIKIDQIYGVVFEKILGEKMSTLPVQERLAKSGT
jgi:hypothetical protein